MDLLHRFKEFVQEQSLFSSGEDRLLLAVSGGLDSVVLVHLCREAGADFLVAHCNFGLRGEESARDEGFVRSLAAQTGVEAIVRHFDTKAYAGEHKVSVQVAARELRYAWFGELLAEKGLKYVLTAHHRDDAVETVLMNLCKGTGIAGLTGIPSKRGTLVRPLLFASRQELALYAEGKGLQWVEDSSNDETKYTRNYFRHQVIPAIEKVYPQAKPAIAGTMERMGEVEALYRQAIALHKKKLVEKKGLEVHIPVLKLQKSKPLATILFEIIGEFGFTAGQVGEVIKLLQSESGRYLTSATHQILRNRAWLVISPLKHPDPQVIVVEAGDKEVSFGLGTLQLEIVPGENPLVSSDTDFVCMDAADIRFPILLRRWRPGDYFYPLGMRKKKKLSRFFIDSKLSKIQKEDVWVLESSRRIIWVVGYRIDDRFKIGPGTQKTLRIRLKRTTPPL